MSTPTRKEDICRKVQIDASVATGTDELSDYSHVPSKTSATTKQHHQTISNAIDNTSANAHPTAPPNLNYLPSKGSFSTTTTAGDDIGLPHVPVKSVEVNISPHLRNLNEISRIEHEFDEGFDSDGEIGPSCDLEDEEGPQMFDEEPLPEESPDANDNMDASTNENNDNADIDNFVNIPEDRLKIIKREEKKGGVADVESPP